MAPVVEPVDRGGERKMERGRRGEGKGKARRERGAHRRRDIGERGEKGVVTHPSELHRRCTGASDFHATLPDNRGPPR